MIKGLLEKRKYEILLLALVMHLFIGIVVSDMVYYAEILWPINMVFLGLACGGVFLEKKVWKIRFKNLLTLVVILFPILLPLFFKGNSAFMLALNLVYVAYFLFIFTEVFKFLVRPGYINFDLISAAACGMLLLIEIFVFLCQILVYNDRTSFNGIDYSSVAHTYTDLVYYCSITLTTIGYGDITPNAHYTKLVASVFAIAGQFYSVVLVGIIISKFASKSSNR